MKISELNKCFDEKIVFDNFTCEFKDGAINYLLGESGSGKTTLLRIIAGLDKDYTGNVPHFDEKIAVVFQEPRLFPAITVLKNVQIVNDKSVTTSVELLKLVELEDSMNLYPNELSGGMKMRVSLARALNFNASIYLLDEPFGALDEATKERLLPKVFEILKNKTVIIVSHNLDEANKYADNIINLNDIIS